jgi:putative oxidoreductase
MTQYLPALGRLLLSLIFVLSGLNKVAAPDATIAYIQSAHLPAPVLAYGVNLLIELGCGLALLVGFQTRAAATVLALFCVVTAVLFHNNLGDQMQMINFMKNLAMAGGLLQVVAFGPGVFSVDTRRLAAA